MGNYYSSINNENIIDETITDQSLLNKSLVNEELLNLSGKGTADKRTVDKDTLEKVINAKKRFSEEKNYDCDKNSLGYKLRASLAAVLQWM